MLYTVFLIVFGDGLAVLEERKKNMHIVLFVKWKRIEWRVYILCLYETTLFLPKAKLKAENMSEVARRWKARGNTFFPSFLRSLLPTDCD